MAFPVVESIGTTYNTGDTDVTNHDISTPSGLVNGEILFVLFNFDGDGTASSSDLTEILDYNHTTGSVGFWAGYRVVDGTEGSTVRVTTSTAEHATGWAVRISGAKQQAPDVSSTSEGNGTNPNPVNYSPPGGAKNRLWVAFCGVNGGTSTPTGWPHADNRTSAETGGSGAAGGAWCTRDSSAASFDPAAFITDSQDWVAVNIVLEEDTGSWEQEGFRFRKDDGSESTATWHAAQDTNVTLPNQTTTRLRILANATDDPASTAFTLQYRKVGDDATEWETIS